MKNSALVLLLEEDADILEPGGIAHDLAHNLISSIRHNYRGLCRDTLRTVATKAMELINLIEDYDASGRDFDDEQKLVNDLLHRIS